MSCTQVLYECGEFDLCVRMCCNIEVSIKSKKIGIALYLRASFSTPLSLVERKKYSMGFVRTRRVCLPSAFRRLKLVVFSIGFHCFASLVIIDPL